MGVVFYRLVTKKLPFKGDTPFAMAQSQVNDPPTPVGVERNDLPPWVDQVVVKSLAKAPEQRFQSAVEFHEAFARCLAGLPLSTTYSSSAPTELLMTPSRAMPTGTIRTPTGLSTGYSTPMPPPPAAAQPPPPPTGSGPVATSGTAAAAAPPLSPGTTAGTTAPNATVVTPKTGAATSGAGKGMPIGVIAAAVLLIAAIGAGAWYFVGRRGSEPAQMGAENAVDTTTPPPADIPLPVDPSAAAATTPATPATGAPAPTTPAPGTAKPGAPPAPATPPPPAPATTEGRGAAAVTPPAAPAKPAIDDTPVTFEDLRLITVRGTKGEDADAVIAFGDGQINVLAKEGRAPLATMSYGRVAKATYVRARDPKWDLAIYGPPPKFDTPGTMFRRAAHWLVIQAADAYMILRLEDRNVQRVLEAVEMRTGVRIDRPAPQ
jgi:serine/threonine-protein kinase